MLIFDNKILLSDRHHPLSNYLPDKRKNLLGKRVRTSVIHTTRQPSTLQNTTLSFNHKHNQRCLFCIRLG